MPRPLVVERKINSSLHPITQAPPATMAPARVALFLAEVALRGNRNPPLERSRTAQDFSSDTYADSHITGTTQVSGANWLPSCPGCPHRPARSPPAARPFAWPRATASAATRYYRPTCSRPAAGKETCARKPHGLTAGSKDRTRNPRRLANESEVLRCRRLSGRDSKRLGLSAMAGL